MSSGEIAPHDGAESAARHALVGGRFRRRAAGSLVPYVVLGSALLLTIVLVVVTQRAREIEGRRQFDATVDEVKDRIETRMESYVANLRGTAALLGVNPGVSFTEYRSYVNRLRITEFYPGIQGIGYSVRVEPREVESPTRRMRRDAHSLFSIRPLHERPEYHAIVYLEPLDRRNQAAIGYDMYTEPVRRMAMERARDGAFAALSGRVTLVQEIDDRKQPGFLVYVPVCQGGDIPDTVTGRRARLQGFAYSPFRAHDPFAGIFGSTGLQGVRLQVYDGRSENPRDLLFSSREPVVRRSVSRPMLQRNLDLPLFGHTWTLAVSSLPEFDARYGGNDLPASILGGGVLVSLLLFYLAQLGARARAAPRESEARKGLVVEAALDAIIMADEEGKITEFNPAAEAAFGLRRIDVLGKDLAETIIPLGLRAAHRNDFRGPLQSGDQRMLGKRIELSVLRVDGSEFPVEMGIRRLGSGARPCSRRICGTSLRGPKPRRSANVSWRSFAR